jgi:hypothetical protein
MGYEADGTLGLCSRLDSTTWTLDFIRTNYFIHHQSKTTNSPLGYRCHLLKPHRVHPDSIEP